MSEEYESAPDEPTENARTAEARVREKCVELRMHAELCAVFEGTWKFEARVVPGLDAGLARELQLAVGKLEKSRSSESPVLPESSVEAGVVVLKFGDERGLSPGDYHISRRPGEVIIARWIAGVDVGTFYERFQSHFDAALQQTRDDLEQNQAWKQDEDTTDYAKKLEAVELKMADVYLRGLIEKHGIFVLSTQAADELDILHLCEGIMRTPPATIVGPASAPPEDSPTEQDRAWFFKLFSLRGMVDGTERMCFFAYLQKVGEEW